MTETEAQQEQRVNARNQRRQDRIEQGMEDEADADDHSDNSRRLTLSGYASFRLHDHPLEQNALLREVVS